MDKHPDISKELMEYLESICPDRSPSLKTPERQIWFDAGKADLVRHLKILHEAQIETVLQGTK